MRALILDFLSHHARMLLDWTDRTASVFDEWSDSATSRDALALAIIRSNLAAYPEPHQPDRSRNQVP